MNDFIKEWRWGKTITIIYDNQGTVELQLQDGCRYVYLCGLRVAPDSRKKGIGTALMKRAEEITASMGLDEIQLKVQDDHLFQYEWYLRLGYKLTEETDGYRYMRKILPTSTPQLPDKYKQ